MGQDGAADFCEVTRFRLRLSKILKIVVRQRHKILYAVFYALCLLSLAKFLHNASTPELQEDGRRVPENPEPWTWFWVNSDICSVSYMWVMIAVSNSWNCSATRSAVCWTSWWFRCCDVMPAARLVIQEMPQTSIPMWRAAIVSQAVLMPTASAPQVRYIRSFCRSFIRWTGKLKVYTFFQRNAEFLGFFLYDLLHPFTIGFHSYPENGFQVLRHWHRSVD